VNQLLFWVTAAAFAALIAAAVWGYRHLARRAELDAAEQALADEYAELEVRPPTPGDPDVRAGS
jgi:hypothetical protein